MSDAIHVELGGRGYPVVVERGGRRRLGDLLAGIPAISRVLVVSDETVDPLYGDEVEGRLKAAGHSVSRARVPPGEETKSAEWLLHLYREAAGHRLDRKAVVLALGGGVVGDLAGFFAATYLRGLRLVQVPTTLLAMVDSAIGGKTGINLPQGKNLVGAFHQPALVLCDPEVLRTLPRRELAAGLAEVIKYGIIRDPDLFQFLEARMASILAGDPDALARVISRSCAIKAAVVSADELETGERAILNFGHTAGHAIEQASGYGRYLHGEAVGIGMAYAARLSARRTGLPASDVERIVRLIRAAELPVAADGLPWADVRAAMSVDKKGSGGTPRFVLARAIGDVAHGELVPERVIEEAWHVGGE